MGSIAPLLKVSLIFTLDSGSLGSLSVTLACLWTVEHVLKEAVFGLDVKVVGFGLVAASEPFRWVAFGH
jgi:hypothetical protein